MKNQKIKIVSIVGPTASGKTKLSTELAEKFKGEIISADSMQIYKEFNILSAKPSKKELQKVNHHLVNIVSIKEEFSVAKFISLAHDCIKKVYLKGKLPFVVGGTGLYIDSLIRDIKFESADIVEDHYNLIKTFESLSGVELMEILKKIDPESSKKIHVNNTKRILRAVKFFYSFGYPISTQAEQSKNIVSRYEVCKIGISFRNRELMYEKIENRVEEMFKSGIIKEVENLRNTKLSKTAKSAIGYNEIVNYLENPQSVTLESVMESIKKSTRHYAKRQLTWFKRDKEINWIYLDDYKNFSEVTDCSKEIIKNFIW